MTVNCALVGISSWNRFTPPCATSMTYRAKSKNSRWSRSEPIRPSGIMDFWVALTCSMSSLEMTKSSVKFEATRSVNEVGVSLAIKPTWTSPSTVKTDCVR